MAEDDREGSGFTRGLPSISPLMVIVVMIVIGLVGVVIFIA